MHCRSTHFQRLRRWVTARHIQRHFFPYLECGALNTLRTSHENNQGFHNHSSHDERTDNNIPEIYQGVLERVWDRCHWQIRITLACSSASREPGTVAHATFDIIPHINRDSLLRLLVAYDSTLHDMSHVKRATYILRTEAPPSLLPMFAIRL